MVLEPTSVAQFGDFNRTGRGGSSRSEGGTEGVILLWAKADRELAIIFEGLSSTQIQYLNERG